MLKQMKENELMNVNGGYDLIKVPVYRVVWQSHYYERVKIGYTWVSDDSCILYYLNGYPQYR